MIPRRSLACVLSALLCAATSISSAQDFSAPTVSVTRQRLLWIEPRDIKTRNLYYGPGGAVDRPREPLAFVEEDKSGTSPKFDVRDGGGVKWKAKLGPEAQPETVAVRLLWAVGFITNENYFIQHTKIDGLPHLKRGQEFVDEEGVRNLRLQRVKDGKKVRTWSWRHNPFRGTREFNGLRVMMALLSNWDLKDDNNAILDERGNTGAEFYEVSDLGASFGRSGKSYSDRITKNNLPAYRRSKFISKTTKRHVDFAFPTHPPFLYAFNLPFFISKMRNHWIGKHIPREDARWIGSELALLSDQQIGDAFRAAGYSAEDVAQYAAVVRSRIAELNNL